MIITGGAVSIYLLCLSVQAETEKEMNQNENDVKKRTMISEDELNDVAGGSFTAEETKSDRYVRPINVFSFAESGATPKFEIGETVMQNTKKRLPKRG